jgi:hypothetical protein
MDMIGAIATVGGLLAKRHSPKPPTDFGGPPGFDTGVGFPSAAPVIVIVFGLLLVGLVFYLSYVMKERRRQGFAQMAARLRLTYSREDPFGILGYPFQLLHKGDGQGIENMVAGVWQEVDLRAFDYWYYDESTNSNGTTSRSYHRFNCVLLPIGADCPHLTIGRETLLSSLADALSFHDIQFESAAFNDEFNVRCEVPKFANDMIDQRMMAWLLATGSDHAYEVVGNRLLVAGPRIDPAELPALLGVARGFVQHVPTVVSSLYPG